MGHGRACVHPAQLPVVAEVFTPSPAELDRARSLLARYEAALASGSAVFVGDDGRLVDRAVVRAARALLARPPISPGVRRTRRHGQPSASKQTSRDPRSTG